MLLIHLKETRHCHILFAKCQAFGTFADRLSEVVFERSLTIVQYIMDKNKSPSKSYEVKSEQIILKCMGNVNRFANDALHLQMFIKTLTIQGVKGPTCFEKDVTGFVSIQHSIKAIKTACHPEKFVTKDLNPPIIEILQVTVASF